MSELTPAERLQIIAELKKQVVDAKIEYKRAEDNFDVYGMYQAKRKESSLNRDIEDLLTPPAADTRRDDGGAR